MPFSSRTGDWTPFIDALFTATSASCVTGLVVVDTYTHWSLFGQLVVLALIQVGGLGFMTFVMISGLLLGKTIHVQERRLVMQSSGTLELSGMVRMIKRIVFGTVLFESLGAILLATQFVPEMGWGTGIYYSIFHSISAFCNAGFDLMGCYEPFSSLTRYVENPVVSLTICGLIIVGGLGFLVWGDIAKNRFHLRSYRLHSKITISMTVILLLGGSLLFYLFEKDHLLADASPLKSVLASFFAAVTPRTAGYNTLPVGELSQSSSLLTIILMFIGGGTGSTAGGIKVTTFVVLAMTVLSSAQQKSQVSVFKRQLDPGITRQASAIASIYLAMILLCTLIICALQPYSLRDVLLEVVSAIGTVGLTAGITPVLDPISKLLLILLMYGGRLGALSLALAFAERKDVVPLNRPVEKILIG